MKNKLGIAIVLLGIIFYFGYNYLYQDHRDINTEQAEFSLNSDTLYQHFIQNQEEANRLYINKVIEINGLVSSKSKKSIVLNPGIVYQIDSTFLFMEIEIGDSIHLRGRCIGFDDIFMEVKMDKTSAI